MRKKIIIIGFLLLTVLLSGSVTDRIKARITSPAANQILEYDATYRYFKNTSTPAFTSLSIADIYIDEDANTNWTIGKDGSNNFLIRYKSGGSWATKLTLDSNADLTSLRNVTATGSITGVGGSLTNLSALSLANNTYIQWRNAADNAWLDVIKLNSSDELEITPVTTISDNVKLALTKNFYLDGGGDTYITSPSADVLDTYIGGVEVTYTEDTDITFDVDDVNFWKADVTNDDFDLLGALNIGTLSGATDTYQTLIDMTTTTTLNDGDAIGFAIKVAGVSGLSVKGLSDGTTLDELWTEHHKATVYTPSSDQTRTDDSTILVDNTIIRVVGDGGAVTLDVSPAIEDGVSDGQMIIIQGTHNTNTVTIADDCNCQLDSGASAVLGQGDTIQLIWDSGDSDWYEISRSAN